MDHINQLIEKLESAAEELKTEYFRLWDEDVDLKEALDLLENSDDYGYDHHGLFKYVDMELDLDEYAADAFEDWLDQHEIQVDNRKSRIFKRVSNYLAAITDMDNLTTVVLKADGKETTLLMEEMFDSREDMVDYLKSTTHTPEVAVLVDEWNNAEVVDLDNQVVYAS